MTARRKRLLITLIVAIVSGVIIAALSIYFFAKFPAFKSLFTGVDQTVEEVSESGTRVQAPAQQQAAPEVRADQEDFSGKVSLAIFIFITLLQVAAVGVGYVVVANIKHGNANVQLKLRNLENAEVFFDVPLYFGLFGTVSSFLVMTFSPQSSRLIAYSSTLIGIIFSLILRLALQYPLRKRLVALDAAGVTADPEADDDDADENSDSDNKEAGEEE